MKHHGAESRGVARDGDRKAVRGATKDRDPAPGRRLSVAAGVLVMLVAVLIFLSPPAGAAGNVTIIQGGRSRQGWVNDRGKIVIRNPRGKTVFYGKMTRMGGVELTDQVTNEIFVGRVNPLGNGLLMSPRTGATLRIEVER